MRSPPSSHPTPSSTSSTSRRTLTPKPTQFEQYMGKRYIENLSSPEALKKAKERKKEQKRIKREKLEEQERRFPTKVDFKPETKRFKVGYDQHDIRLDDFVAKSLTIPKNLARLKIINGEVAVVKSTHAKYARIRPHGKLNTEDWVEIVVGIRPVNEEIAETYFRQKDQSEAKEMLETLKSSIVYKDERILVINKPPGLASQGGSKVKLHLNKFLEDLEKDGKEPLRLVHRLDKDTTGVLILARTKAAATQVSDMIQDGRMEKTYWAVVSPTVEKQSGEIVTGMVPVGEAPNEKQVIVEWHDEDTRSSIKAAIKKAVTSYNVLDSRKGVSLLELRPATGRKHQLRVHCASVLHAPVVGDYKYGPGVPKALAGMAPKARKYPMHLHLRGVVLKDWYGSGGHAVITAPTPLHFTKLGQSIGLKVSGKKTEGAE
ncbi:hypothetical protein HK097_008348 [Rhizophlyctis rosea]|uniref:Pseudouridine synthase RsuA/RluA-like domain-containing protein n=1 Tax=Rhizophlyctis rosea TaxID=64517 RepID=A0AAD5SBY2_9FUNG|nr:hypothetical protein HK097_008348 [Rhizophlyctis rosea]